MVRLGLLMFVIACGGSRRTAPPPPPPIRPPVEPVELDPLADVLNDEPPPSPADDDEPGEIACEDGIHDPASFPPVVAVDAPEREWDLALRAHVLGEDCEHQWTTDLKQCLFSGTAATCAAQLPPDLTERLVLIDKLSAAIAGVRKKPASVGCKQAVANHYGDAHWQGRLEGFSGRIRTQMIADSRKLMLAACTRDGWDEITRACLVLGGEDVCFINANPPIRHMWGYPADGSVHTVGIIECDTYATLVGQLASCKKVASYTKDSLVRMTNALLADIAGRPPAERAKAADSCESALGTIATVLRNAGC